MSTFQVCERKCDQCLFSANRVVSKARAKKIIEKCLSQDRYFICHKSSLAGEEEICCKGFHDSYKYDVALTRFCEISGLTEFVPIPQITNSNEK